MEPERNMWEQNVALWEKWTSQYTDTMFKAMEKSMDQSSSIRSQLDKAVNSAGVQSEKVGVIWGTGWQSGSNRRNGPRLPRPIGSEHVT